MPLSQLGQCGSIMRKGEFIIKNLLLELKIEANDEMIEMIVNEMACFFTKKYYEVRSVER